MTDEAQPLPKTTDLKHTAFRMDIHATPKAPETALGSLLKKVAQIFNRTPHSDSKLSGRIHELQTTADEILHGLTAFKSKIEKETDRRLFSLVCGIIDPISKEIARLQKVMERQGGATQQVKSYTRYVEWIEKARYWISLGDGSKDLEAIQQAVIQQTIQEFQTRIDKDIQIIQDYLNHAVENLVVSDDMRNVLKHKLDPELSPNLLKLYQLKEHPQDLSLDSLIPWRSAADHDREIFFSSSLHAIDTFFTDFLPSPAKEKESELSLMLLMQLGELEDKIARILADIEDQDSNEEFSNISLRAALDRLEDEAHELNANLRLTHEHEERLQKSLNTLAHIRDKLV